MLDLGPRPARTLPSLASPSSPKRARQARTVAALTPTRRAIWEFAIPLTGKQQRFGLLDLTMRRRLRASKYPQRRTLPVGHSQCGSSSVHLQRLPSKRPTILETHHWYERQVWRIIGTMRWNRRSQIARGTAAYGVSGFKRDTLALNEAMETYPSLRAAAARSGLYLDHSPESLVTLDGLLARWRQEGDQANDLSSEICRYLGSVIRRASHGAVWKIRRNGQPVVRLAGGREVNPMELAGSDSKPYCLAAAFEVVTKRSA